MNATAIHTAEATRRWLASRVVLWGEDTEKGKSDPLLATLADFCERAGKSPDEIIDECLRRATEGGPFVLRTRARRRYIDLIAEYEADTGSREQANVVRSFFIHNGVAMNPSVLMD
jgi:hypothetical protein